MKIAPVIDSIADRAFARFERVARPMPGGGWYDPVHGSPQMPAGILGERWDGFERDCARLGKGKKA